MEFEVIMREIHNLKVGEVSRPYPTEEVGGAMDPIRTAEPASMTPEDFLRSTLSDEFKIEKKGDDLFVTRLK